LRAFSSVLDSSLSIACVVYLQWSLNGGHKWLSEVNAMPDCLGTMQRSADQLSKMEIRLNSTCSSNSQTSFSELESTSVEYVTVIHQMRQLWLPLIYSLSSRHWIPTLRSLENTTPRSFSSAISAHTNRISAFESPFQCYFYDNEPLCICQHLSWGCTPDARMTEIRGRRPRAAGEGIAVISPRIYYANAFWMH